MNAKLVSELLGGHVHLRVFVGPDRGHLALIGELVMLPQEAAAVEDALVMGMLAQRIPVAPELRWRSPWLPVWEAYSLLGRPLTWTCHICAEERPDALISVIAHDRSAEHGLPPGTYSENVRYCNDRPACEEGARQKRHL